MGMSFNSKSRTPLGTDPDSNWDEGEKVKTDWKKRALVVGLGVLSWVATYVGMLELIEANMGELPIVHKLIIGFSVAMLMTMVVWLLDEMFKPNPFVTKAMYAFGYVFLSVISIGFGFGFYWKVLESRSEASRSAEGAVTQVQGSLVAASTRLDQLQTTLDQLTTVSTQKAKVENTSGTSCPNSKPGDGPRRKLREDDAARFSFAAEFVKGRATTVKTEMAGLDVDLLKITGDDKSIIDAKTGNRNAFMQSLGRKLDNTVTGFNAFRTDPQLKQIRLDLADRAEKTTFPDTQGKTYTCPDAQLQTALRGVVRAIDQLPELEKPKIAAVEGSEATIEAFRRLTTSFYGLLSFKLPPSADELRDLQKKAIQSVEAPSAAAKAASLLQPGLSKRDYVPLAIAVFVDLCLLLVSMGKSHDRLGGLLPKMRAAERGPVIQILSRFNDIHRDQQIRENFELFRHVVFDFHGDYYVAVPMDAPRKLPPRDREELRLEAQLLSNLFASFEKEKIFTRVYSPFLTSGVIRKRLARQGSKFANSDAFRMYRFKDGAWSDIILGAVMGAAKRVETQKAKQVVIDDELRRTQPVLPLPSPVNEPTHEEPTQAPQWPSPRAPAAAPHSANLMPPLDVFGRQGWPENVHPLPQRGTGFEAQRGTGFEAQRGTGFEPQRGPDHNMNQRAASHDPQRTRDVMSVDTLEMGFHPANSNTVPALAVSTPVGAASDQSGPVYNPADTHAGATGPTHAEPATYTYQTGNAALAVAEPVRRAMVSEPATVLPAMGQPIQVSPVQATVDWQSQLGIVVQRVTESVTIPVTAASLPAALLRAHALHQSSQAPVAQSIEATFEPVEQATSLSTSEIEIEPEAATHIGDWNDTDTLLARRYARNPAE
jgi:hypothetical protein